MSAILNLKQTLILYLYYAHSVIARIRKGSKLEYEEPKKNFGFDRIGNEVPLNLLMY
jgi:uncharacterized membrane protein